jgi:hypothetical protein
MQHQPSSWLTRSLLLTLALGLVWAAIAGMDGYTLGNPPTGITAAFSCYRTLKVDFIVPMYKPAACATSSSPVASPPVVATPTAPAGGICDDPNAATDGNVSGEMPCSDQGQAPSASEATSP